MVEWQKDPFKMFRRNSNPRILDLADEVKTLVEHRELEMGHARALLSLENRRQQSEVGALVARKKLSVRETEAQRLTYSHGLHPS